MPTGPTDWGLVFNVASSIASIVVSIVAIVLACYFYTQAKNTEASTEAALAAIGAQTNSLERITARQLDRLIRVVATRPEAGGATAEALAAALAAAKELPKALLEKQDQLRDALAKVDQSSVELLAAVIAVHYYTAIANSAWQGIMMSGGDQPGGSRRIVDMTSGDFWFTDGLLNQMDPTVIASNRLAHLHKTTINIWRSGVRDAATVDRHAAAAAAAAAAAPVSA